MYCIFKSIDTFKILKIHKILKILKIYIINLLKSYIKNLDRKKSYKKCFIKFYKVNTIQQSLLKSLRFFLSKLSFKILIQYTPLNL